MHSNARQHSTLKPLNTHTVFYVIYQSNQEEDARQGDPESLRKKLRKTERRTAKNDRRA